MRFAREVSGISHGVSLGLLAALYVRDSLALSVDVEPHVPGLDPSLPVQVPPGTDRAAVTAEWPGWWADALDACRRGAEPETPEDAEALLTRPASRAVVLALKPGIEQLHRVQSPAGVADRRRAARHRVSHRPVGAERASCTSPRCRSRACSGNGSRPRTCWRRTRFLNDPARTAPALRAGARRPRS